MLQFIQDKNIENSHFEAFQTLPIGRIRIAWVRTSQTLKYSLGSFPFRCILHFLFRLWAGRKCWENSAIYGHEYKSLQKLRWVRLFGRWSLKWSPFSKTFENFWTLQLEVHPALQNAYHVFPFSINLFLQCTFHPLSFVYMLFCAFSLYSFGPNCFCSCRCYKVICFFMTMLLK